MLLTIDEITVGYLELEQDILFHKIPDNERVELIREAIEFGRQSAHDTIEKFSTRDPFTIANNLNVEIKLDPNTKTFGKTLVYSECLTKDRKIIIYEGSLSHKAELVSIYGLDKEFPNDDLKAVHAAHELFHNIVEWGKGSIKDKHKIVTLKLGPIQTRSPIRALDEIAADNFVKVLLNMKYSPRLLDYFATENPSLYIEKIQRLSKELVAHGRKRTRAVRSTR